MIKKLSVCMVLCLVSCTNYIRVIPTDQVPDTENITRKIFFHTGTLDISFYADYIFDRTAKKEVFFTNKYVREILNHFNAEPCEQILFTYTPGSIYNNMLGFYYEGKKIEDVKKFFSVKTPEKEMQNGLQFIYQHKGYDVMEIYIQEEKGILRFISINNPAKQSVDKFKLENNKIFFELNTKFWLGQ